MAEQLIRNEQVDGSIPFTSSIKKVSAFVGYLFYIEIEERIETSTTHLLRKQKANIILTPQASAWQSHARFRSPAPYNSLLR